MFVDMGLYVFNKHAFIATLRGFYLLSCCFLPCRLKKNRAEIVLFFVVFCNFVIFFRPNRS